MLGDLYINGSGAVQPQNSRRLYVPSRPRRTRRSPRHHFRHGQRAAVRRALTAAQLYASGAITSIAKAAEGCGSNIAYVQAAIILLKAENTTLLDRVLAGHEPLVGAAQAARRMANLVAAYRTADSADRIAFARTCGTDALLDVLVKATSHGEEQ